MSNAIGDKLLKNTLIYSIGSFGSKILSFLLLPLFSLYLTTVEMGQFNICFIGYPINNIAII